MSEKVFSDFGYSEFVDYALNTKRVIGSDGIITKSSEENDFDFTGTYSMEEAIKFARYGWDSGIKEMNLEKELLIDGQFECYNSIVGSSVDVGAYLSGNPECMIQFVDKIERDRPELTIYTMLSYNAGKRQSDALEYAKRVLKIIVNANKEYSVKLVGVFTQYHSSKNVDAIDFITIKDFYQNLVLNNLAFSFHPSFFRRIWFRYVETKPYRSWGYGQPFEESKYRNEIKIYHNKSNKSKAWVLPTFQDHNNNWSDSKILKF